MDENNFSCEFLENILKVSFPKGTLIAPELIIEVYTKELSLLQTKGMNDLWDFRDCVVSKKFSSRSMQNIIDTIKKTHSSDLKHLKAALLIDTELALGMARMFQIMGEDLPYKIKIFKEEAQARSWLADSST